MNKIGIGVLLGTVLGAFDGLSALVSAGDDPAIREGIVGIVVGSTLKGLVAGLLLGWFARRVRSVRAGVIMGLVVGAALAAAICVMQLAADQPPYWLEIMLPGSVVGLIVGFATQKYGRAPSRGAAAGSGAAAALALAAALAAGSAPTVSVAQDAAPAGAAADRTAPFRRFLGEWRAHDLQGAPGRARVVWERGTGPHLLRVDTWLAAPGKAEEKIYDGFLFWHPGRQAYVLQEFSAWGSVYDGTVTVDDAGLVYDWASFEGGGVKHYRQSLAWIDADSYSWKVELETPAGWSLTHQGLWKRVR